VIILRTLAWFGIAMMGFALVRALTDEVGQLEFFIAIMGMALTFTFGSIL